MTPKTPRRPIRIGFTAQGGLVVWSHFLRQKRFRQQLREVLPHDPTSPNAYDPTDVALGYVGGILAGADKLSRVAWLQGDAAVAEVLLQRRLGQLEKCELNPLRWRLFGRAAVWSRCGGKPTLKLTVRGEANRYWWREMLSKLTAPPNCHAVASLQA